MASAPGVGDRLGHRAAARRSTRAYRRAGPSAAGPSAGLASRACAAGPAVTGAAGCAAVIRSASWSHRTWAPAASASRPVTVAWTRRRASSQVGAAARSVAAGAARLVPARAVPRAQPGPASVMRTARRASASGGDRGGEIPAAGHGRRFHPVQPAEPRGQPGRDRGGAAGTRAAGVPAGQPERDRGDVRADLAGRAGRGGPPGAGGADDGRQGPVQVAGDHTPQRTRFAR